MALLFVINMGRPIESDALARLGLSERIIEGCYVSFGRPRSPTFCQEAPLGQNSPLAQATRARPNRFGRLMVKTLAFGAVLR